MINGGVNLAPEYIVKYIFSNKELFILSSYDNITIVKPKKILPKLDNLILLSMNLKTFEFEFRFKDSRKDLEFVFDKDEIEKLILSEV